MSISKRLDIPQPSEILITKFNGFDYKENNGIVEWINDSKFEPLNAVDNKICFNEKREPIDYGHYFYECKTEMMIDRYESNDYKLFKEFEGELLVYILKIKNSYWLVGANDGAYLYDKNRGLFQLYSEEIERAYLISDEVIKKLNK